jgi:shikimate kinase
VTGHLVLVGMMGAGKSAVAQRCAARLGRDCVDTDELVVTLAGATIPEVFAAEGEEGFRAWERRAVADAAASVVPLVIACGGGAVLDAANRAALRAHGTVVWLRARPETLADRVGDGSDRPLLRPEPLRPETLKAEPIRAEPLAALRRLATVRDSAYRAAADATVDTDDRDLDDVTSAVLAAAKLEG